MTHLADEEQWRKEALAAWFERYPDGGDGHTVLWFVFGWVEATKRAAQARENADVERYGNGRPVGMDHALWVALGYP